MNRTICKKKSKDKLSEKIQEKNNLVKKFKNTLINILKILK